MRENALSYVHRLLRDHVTKGDFCIDATVGNGHDTEVLASLVGDTGIVYGFDIQEQALRSVSERGVDRLSALRLLHAGHEQMAECIASEHRGSIAAITFNLGYLPGGDKSVTTMTSTTIDAIEQGASLLRPGGLMTIVCYSHPEGLRELAAIRELLRSWPQEVYTCSETNFFNQRGNPPVVFCVYSNPQ